ncbi:hypothetical protein FFK22_041055 [Mycobacterium sp. KBS0706]|uniref:hypothetical protein n=1 Tax=Mycobacterium sp. KBS0706 TaxID=2578109 RepID=UPI00110FD9F7|nr:hypothetical protein [Mycobacterium sp. KBS0706]TSD82825.1 hypothetical protein FFK22_041055 [Mycobacterium sp. KBS0706]
MSKGDWQNALPPRDFPYWREYRDLITEVMPRLLQERGGRVKKAAAHAAVDELFARQYGAAPLEEFRNKGYHHPGDYYELAWGFGIKSLTQRRITEPSLGRPDYALVRRTGGQ